MAFHDVLFPEAISYGSSGGPGFSTSIIELGSGAEQRVARWTAPRHRYNAKFGIKKIEDLFLVKTFYMARNGCAHSFRFLDKHDYTSNPVDGRVDPTNTDQTIGTGDGSTDLFQLIKTYSSGGHDLIRNITKPIDGTVLISIDDVGMSTGWSINPSTGIISFTNPPDAGAVIKAGYKFHVHARFGSELDEAFAMVYDTHGSGSYPDVPIIEVIDEAPVSHEFFYGGAVHHDAVYENMSIAVSDGRAHSFYVGNRQLRIALPDHTDLVCGGPYFFLHCEEGSTFDLNIEDHLGAAVCVLPSGRGIVIYLGYELNTGNKYWYAV